MDAIQIEANLVPASTFSAANRGGVGTQHSWVEEGTEQAGFGTTIIRFPTIRYNLHICSIRDRGDKDRPQLQGSIA